MEKYQDLIINGAIAYAPKVLLAFITLIVGFWIIRKLTDFFGGIMQTRGIDATIQPFLQSLVNVGLKVMLLLSVASMFGINTTSFVAIFTALAFAIGTALSGSLGHFASGTLLLIFRPYKVGDLVNLSGQTGVVSEIQVFNTVLLTPDNKKIIIPNGVVTGGIITNISGQGKIRVDMNYQFANSNDIDKIREIVKGVADSCPQVLKDTPTDIFVNGLPTGAIDFAIRPWAKSEHYWDVYFYMQENIKKTCDKNGIAFPDPMREWAKKNG